MHSFVSSPNSGRGIWILFPAFYFHSFLIPLFIPFHSWKPDSALVSTIASVAFSLETLLRGPWLTPTSTSCCSHCMSMSFLVQFCCFTTTWMCMICITKTTFVKLKKKRMGFSFSKVQIPLVSLKNYLVRDTKRKYIYKT